MNSVYNQQILQWSSKTLCVDNYYLVLENNPKQISMLIGLRPCFYDSIGTHAELARAVDVMMAQAKRIYILMVEVNKFIFFLCIVV